MLVKLILFTILLGVLYLFVKYLRETMALTEDKKKIKKTKKKK